MAASPLEWSLITLSAPASTSSSSRTDELAALLVEADFKAVLFSDEGKRVLADQILWEGLIPSATTAASGSAPADDAVNLIVGVALLHSFIQANFTGPDLPYSLTGLLPSTEAANIDSAEINAAALPLLTLGGEPAYHLSVHPALLLLARRILLNLDTAALPTLPWWLLRLHAAHQSLLDEPVSIDSDSLTAAQALLESIPQTADFQDIRASLHVELGLYHHQLGNDKPSNQEFLAAAKASELTYELTGALGRKTKYQVNALTQLVLLAESRKREGDEAEAEQAAAPAEGAEGEEAGASVGEGSKAGQVLPEGLKLNDDTLLEETAFTSNSRPDAESSGSALAHLDPGNQPPLHPLDQSLLLGLCLNTHNALPSSGLTASQMMPFLARVVQHPRNWSVHTTALLLRSRLEAARSRTVERATLQLAALIEQMPTSDSSTKERLRYVHQLPLPSKWEMERELAKRYLTVGVTRSALEVFTRLEMWEDAVACLQRMDREDEAERIVRDLLEGRKVESELVAPLVKAGEERKTRMHAAREAKLWCLLGDIALGSDEASKDPVGAKEKAKDMYGKAWEISNGTSSRSRRSLGSLLVSEGNFEEAIQVLQDAVKINPLYSRVWFTLGVCFTRLERWGEAKDAFRRQVGVDEEDGEGWNNLAAVYLRMGEVKGDDEIASVSFDNKLLAFRALRTGLRFAPANWRMWANYMLIAIDVGELSESARAMSRLLEEQPVAVVDADVLDKLVDSVTRDDYNSGTPLTSPTTSNEGWGLLPILERLFDVVILPRVSDDPRVWKAHARLNRWKEDWEAAMEDHLRAYRCVVVDRQEVERDEEEWKVAVMEVEETVGVMQVLGPKAKTQAEKREQEGTAGAEGAKRKKGDWKFQAKGMVRTFMGRTRELFEDKPEWQTLQDLMDELKQAD